MVLISASHSFEQLFMGKDKHCIDNKNAELFILLKCSCETTDPTNRLEVCKACTCKAKVQTTLCREACSFLLKVLYSGGSELFKNASKKDKKTIVEFLSDHKIRNELNCEQFTEEEPSVPSSAVKAKKLFLNKPFLSDVTFTVKGHLVFAHKAVLIARSEVIARMLMGRFVESTAAQVIRKLRSRSLPQLNADQSMLGLWLWLWLELEVSLGLEWLTMVDPCRPCSITVI